MSARVLITSAAITAVLRRTLAVGRSDCKLASDLVSQVLIRRVYVCMYVCVHRRALGRPFSAPFARSYVYTRLATLGKLGQ
ncbi:hypothetical protein C8Q80DRAFT_1188450 [Daedaleopsis nitida]|nr:hypothetical protein C8Q80DRAFT_1188450 [Daedaleopsis nitida]